MRNISSVADLKDAISELEFNRAVHRRMLKDSFNATVESLKPGNVLKNVVSAVWSPSLLTNILPAAVGLGAGFISNKLVSGVAGSSKVRKILFSVALYGITKALVKSPELNRMFGQRIMSSIFSR